ncbi:hypothetical protein K3495_g2868 [Podosphaera aphanis]|nr:hypothetical protein K3495_g2868 [Podosphaera aphanis]
MAASTIANIPHVYKSKWGDVNILTETNFSKWRVSCELDLINAGVFEIIDGSYTKPSANTWSVVGNAQTSRPQTRSESANSHAIPANVNTTTNPVEEREWIDKSRQALINPTNSIQGQLKEMSLDFAKKVDPVGLWKSLLELDPNKDPSNVDTFREEFYAVKMDQANDTIQSVLLRLNSIRAKLSLTSRPVSDLDVKERLIASLPKDNYWATVRLYARETKKTLAETITYLQASEANFQSTPSNASAQVARETPRSRGPKKNKFRRNNHQEKGKGINKSNRGNRGSSRSKARNECDFCGKFGRKEEDCYIKKSMRKTARERTHRESADAHYVQVQNTNDSSYLSTSSSVITNFKARIRYSRRQKGAGRKTENVFLILCCVPLFGLALCAIYFIGILFRIISKPYKARASPAIAIRALLTKLNPPLTIVDSGTSEHFSGIGTEFTSLKRWNEPKTVQIADGNTVQCDGYGTISFTTDKKKIDLKEVWFVPSFGNTRLLSVWAFNKRGIDVVFIKHRCQVKRGQQVLFEAEGEDGVYKIQTKSTTTAMSVTHNVRPAGSQNSETELDILHRRLGHINHRDINKLLKSGCTGFSINNKRTDPIGSKSCEACLAGKMKEHFNKKTDSRESTILRRVHCDISGIQSVSVRGYRYYLLVVDDATRMCWIRLLKTKEMIEVLSAFKEIKTEAELLSGNRITLIRADNGKSEFGTAFQSYCKEIGIQLEPSPPYKHSMNGVAERWMGITAVIARSTLYEAQLPHQLWDYAIEHAVWIKNRSPTSALPFTQDNNEDFNTP